MKFEVEKFDGTNNFGMWQCEIMDVLNQQDFDLVFEKNLEKTTDVKWKNNNRSACGKIRLFLPKDVKYSIMKDMDAQVLWKTLEDKYMTKSIENRLYMKKKLFHFEYEQGISMNEHLNRYNKILADLQNLNVEIEDEHKALLLLNSLPEKYEHLTTTLLSVKNEIKFADVSSALVNNKCRKLDAEVQRDQDEALNVRVQNHKSENSSRDKGKKLARDECSFCHKRGHWKSDCPMFENANIAGDGDDLDDFVLFSSIGCIGCEDCIMDTGCSYHMCSYKTIFSTFHKLDGGVVILENGDACMIKGIDRLRIELNDGITRILGDVRFVPNLKKNVISLGILEAKGYSVTMEGGVLKFCKGDVAILRESRKDNVYYLEVSLVVGSLPIGGSSSALVRGHRHLEQFGKSINLGQRTMANGRGVKVDIGTSHPMELAGSIVRDDLVWGEANMDSFSIWNRSDGSFGKHRPACVVRESTRLTDLIGYALSLVDTSIPASYSEA